MGPGADRHGTDWRGTRAHGTLSPMGKRAAFIVGAAVGYVLGARAGHRRYEQIRDTANKVWQNPTVQTKVETAEQRASQAVKDAATSLGALAFEKAKEAVRSAGTSGSTEGTADGSTHRTSTGVTSTGGTASRPGPGPVLPGTTTS